MDFLESRLELNNTNERSKKKEKQLTQYRCNLKQHIFQFMHTICLLYIAFFAAFVLCFDNKFVLTTKLFLLNLLANFTWCFIIFSL